jgi:hypothetical protein
MPHIAVKAELFGALQHALQYLSRTDWQRDFLAVLLRDELSEEERHAAVPRHVPIGAEIDLREDVGESLVPAGQRRVVVGDVHHVPAEHHVAEAEAAFGRGIELVLVEILAAQHAVDVRDGDLDAVARRVAHGGNDRGGRRWVRHAFAPGRDRCILAQDGRRDAPLLPEAERLRAAPRRS